MDDYYALLGVDTDARTDDIRSAYREKKAALDTTDTDSAKTEVARLNKAWNVLSDPYQRGRYDEQRARAAADGELEDVDELDTAPASPRIRRQAAARQRQAQVPTIELPTGMQWAENRRRIIAMAIDLAVLAVLFFVASQVLGPAIARSMRPDTVDRVEQLRDELNDARDEASDLDEAADEAEDKADESGSEADREAADEARARADAASDAEDNLTDEYNEESQKLLPIYIATIGGAFLVGLIYLAVPSARSGQTLGKRLQHIRVVRQDGSEIGFGDAIRRYGLIILATFALYIVLRELAPIVVLFVVTGWMRNANHQGLQDRIAKTIVVADDRADA
jgi:uncharacterized RDD family membrane protein YckC